MSVPLGEPVAGPWRAVSEAELLALVLQAAGDAVGRPRVVALDGRGASGKSTLAARLARQVARSAVVHTDDIAWYEPYFKWGHLLADHVLRPLRLGEAVDFRPPAWDERGRKGAVDVPAALDLVIVEGVGAGQRELGSLVDATVWVQSDFAETEARGIARDIALGINGNKEQTIAFWREWMAEELAFLHRQRPWERACLVVAGTSTIRLDDDQVAIAANPCYANRS